MPGGAGPIESRPGAAAGAGIGRGGPGWAGTVTAKTKVGGSTEKRNLSRRDSAEPGNERALQVLVPGHSREERCRSLQSLMQRKR